MLQPKMTSFIPIIMPAVHRSYTLLLKPLLTPPLLRALQLLVFNPERPRYGQLVQRLVMAHHGGNHPYSVVVQKKNSTRVLLELVADP